MNWIPSAKSQFSGSMGQCWRNSLCMEDVDHPVIISLSMPLWLPTTAMYLQIVSLTLTSLVEIISTSYAVGPSSVVGVRFSHRAGSPMVGDVPGAEVYPLASDKRYLMGEDHYLNGYVTGWLIWQLQALLRYCHCALKRHLFAGRLLSWVSSFFTFAIFEKAVASVRVDLMCLAACRRFRPLIEWRLIWPRPVRGRSSWP